MKMNPTIIVASYNRPKSLIRILMSLDSARYHHFNSIRLVISVDGGGDNFGNVCEVADKFEWKNGEKLVIKHGDNLGLRNHIIYCGDLSNKYGDIILLEDDLFVSPNFYLFATSALNYYRESKKIAGVSLYSYSFNENAGLAFKPMKSNRDTFFMQVPSSWGQAWTSEQWSNFKRFYEKNIEIKDIDKLPENVKQWPETSWKKYFYRYIVEKDLYFTYPYLSQTSNYGDVGVHYKEKSDILQVELDFRDDIYKYDFDNIENSLIMYDAYFELLPRCFKLVDIKEVCDDIIIDLYGTKQYNIFNNNEEWLTVKKTNNFIKGFSGSVLPLSENIFRNIEGDFFVVTKKCDIVSEKFEDVKMKLSRINGMGIKIKKINDNLVKETKTFKVGDLFYRSIKRPYKILTFPINLVRIMKK